MIPQTLGFHSESEEMGCWEVEINTVLLSSSVRQDFCRGGKSELGCNTRGQSAQSSYVLGVIT